MTKKRTAILEMLKATDELLTAADIHERLSDIDLVTIYRNLDLFSKEGVVKKMQFGEEAKYEYQKRPHHHAICTVCDRTIHFTVSDEKLARLLPIKDFSVANTDITITGTCKNGH